MFSGWFAAAWTANLSDISEGESKESEEEDDDPGNKWDWQFFGCMSIYEIQEEFNTSLSAVTRKDLVYLHWTDHDYIQK